MSGKTDIAVLHAVEEAEGLTNPLDGLLEKAATDPGAPFVPDVVSRLSELKREDAAAFEVLRSQLKSVGIRVVALDEVIAKESGEESRHEPKQADILIKFAEDVGLLHTSNGTGFADLEINGHRETWPIFGKGFRRWLACRFFKKTAGAPNSEALQAALNVIEARSQFGASQAEVHLRVAGHRGKLYLDLADEAWRAVEVDGDGWRIVDEPPVQFRRTAGMKTLPEPVSGGSVEMLRPFLNLRNDDDFVLIVAWALAVLRDRGPYPVIALSGEQGTAKSTFSTILRALLDPNSAPLRALPREDRDLFIAATNGHILAFDNISGLRPWISDTLCRLASGGGFAVRQLYTDQDEVLFEAARPIILNGIEEIVTRSDLADRAIFLTLEPIPEERRKTESELWNEFEKVRPQILGALLDAVSTGLNRVSTTRLDSHPRMADFAVWVTACEAELWPEDTFRQAYAGNRDRAVDTVIEADPVGVAIRSLMDKETQWSGTASDLLERLGEEVGDSVRGEKSWPANPRALSGRVRRVATFLRQVGIEIAFEREGRARTRTITISSGPKNAAARPSAPSAATP